MTFCTRCGKEINQSIVSINPAMSPQYKYCNCSDHVIIKPKDPPKTMVKVGYIDGSSLSKVNP